MPQTKASTTKPKRKRYYPNLYQAIDQSRSGKPTKSAKTWPASSRPHRRRAGHGCNAPAIGRQRIDGTRKRPILLPSRSRETQTEKAAAPPAQPSARGRAESLA